LASAASKASRADPEHKVSTLLMLSDDPNFFECPFDSFDTLRVEPSFLIPERDFGGCVLHPMHCHRNQYYDEHWTKVAWI
jgi:hypothetical protein